MITLAIEIPDKAVKTLSNLVEQLGGKVVAVDSVKKTKKGVKKQQILDDNIRW